MASCRASKGTLLGGLAAKPIEMVHHVSDRCGGWLVRAGGECLGGLDPRRSTRWFGSQDSLQMSLSSFEALNTHESSICLNYSCFRPILCAVFDIMQISTWSHLDNLDYLDRNPIDQIGAHLQTDRSDWRSRSDRSVY
jgi:hypothetical protein